MDAQADLSLRQAHSHFAGFVMRWLKLFIQHTGIVSVVLPIQNMGFQLTTIVLAHAAMNMNNSYAIKKAFTVMILRFQTDRSGKTVQTQIRGAI